MFVHSASYICDNNNNSLFHTFHIDITSCLPYRDNRNLLYGCAYPQNVYLYTDLAKCLRDKIGFIDRRCTRLFNIIPVQIDPLMNTKSARK